MSPALRSSSAKAPNVSEKIFPITPRAWAKSSAMTCESSSVGSVGSSVSFMEIF